MNLIERIVGKVEIFLFKRDLKEIRRAREWRYYLEHEIPETGSQLAYAFVREDIVKAVTRYHSAD